MNTKSRATEIAGGFMEGRDSVGRILRGRWGEVEAKGKNVNKDGAEMSATWLVRKDREKRVYENLKRNTGR